MKFVTDDGKTFTTFEEARDHEAAVSKAKEHKLLCGLKATDIEDALAYKNIPLNKALEKIGRLCGDARRDAGVIKRRPRGSTAPLAQIAPDDHNVRSQVKDGDVTHPATEAPAPAHETRKPSVVLAVANVKANEGRYVFNRWYRDDLNDAERDSLSGSIKELLAAAEASDEKFEQEKESAQ